MNAAERNLCVLFADVCGGDQLTEALGDAEAQQAIDRCINRMDRAASAFGGHVVKTIGDELLAIFENPDEAMFAACEMQQRVNSLPPASGIKLAVRVAFHYGAIAVEGGAISGETVDLAARMVGLARAGQIITGAVTVTKLAPSLRISARAVSWSTRNSGICDLPLCEVFWQKSTQPLAPSSGLPAESVQEPRLRLLYGQHELVLNEFKDAAALGRDINSDIVIRDPRASRNHARIERRRDGFVLIDQSTNGTFLSVAGESEIVLRREEVLLRSRGFVSSGHPYGDGGDGVVEFEVMTQQN
jgi:adenylate cyclase